jgi:alcohol dehydrogenase class IV
LDFEFATSNRIIFGAGTVSEVPNLAVSLGRRIFYIYNRSTFNQPIVDSLISAGLNPLPYQVHGEPTIDSVQKAVEEARKGKCDVVIGMGGGSTLDTGKAVGILLNNPGNLTDYLEIVGTGRAFQNPSLPYIAIPTTAGTGSEVTRNAVILIPDHQIKVSLRSHYMLPRYSIVDPELSYGMPPEITASTGLDALTQLIEPFVCNTPNPMSDAICREGIPRIARSLLTAYGGHSTDAREDMALASMFGGIALANARLGAVHGLASPIGGMIASPHGSICARLLPIVFEANIKALQDLPTGSNTMNRFREVARLLTGDPTSNPEDGVEWIWNVCNYVKILPLGQLGLNPTFFPAIISKAQQSTSMKGNPVSLSNKELIDILHKSI